MEQVELYAQVRYAVQIERLSQREAVRDKERPKEQQHTAKRIFERLRDEHGYKGGITIVKDYVAGWRQRSREMFVPFAHPPGHAQADFGEALAIIAGVERKINFFAFDLPHSDACFVIAYPAETTEAFCDGHVKAFEFFGGIPLSILYDNTRIAVARILGDGKRQRTKTFSELQSHCVSGPVRASRQGQRQGQGRGARQVREAELHGADPGFRQLRGVQL